LVAVFGEFLRDTLGKGKDSYYLPALLLTSVVSIGMAMTGLEGITAVTSPVLQVGYPLLLVLILGSLSRRAFIYLRASYTTVPAELPL
jgi:branched-subunit amino acid permease